MDTASYVEISVGLWAWQLQEYHFVLNPQIFHQPILKDLHSVKGRETEGSTFMKTEAWTLFRISSVQLLSHVWLLETSWIGARHASLSITNSQSSLRLMSIESVMPSSHLILCCPLLLLLPIPPSIKVFPTSQLFAWGGPSTGVSALPSFLPKKSQS